MLAGSAAFVGALLGLFNKIKPDWLTCESKHGLLVLGSILAHTGYAVFKHNSIGLGALMTFSAGGILYLVFKDIAPQSSLKKNWLPSLGAVFGFMLGMTGYALTS